MIEPDESRCYYCGEEIEFVGDREYATLDGITDSHNPRYHYHSWQKRPYPWQRIVKLSAR
jgi:hypothetical protein